MFDTRRFGWFTLALTVLFLANFYIAYVVGIFTFLLFAGWLFTRPEEKNLIGRRLGAFFGGTALGSRDGRLPAAAHPVFPDQRL